MKNKIKRLLPIVVVLVLIACVALFAGCNNNNEPTVEPHKCAHVCLDCGKCTSDCTDTVCADKCQGGHPDYTSSVSFELPDFADGCVSVDVRGDRSVTLFARCSSVLVSCDTGAFTVKVGEQDAIQSEVNQIEIHQVVVKYDLASANGFTMVIHTDSVKNITFALQYDKGSEFDPYAVDVTAENTFSFADEMYFTVETADWYSFTSEDKTVELTNYSLKGGVVYLVADTYTLYSSSENQTTVVVKKAEEPVGYDIENPIKISDEGKYAVPFYAGKTVYFAFEGLIYTNYRFELTNEGASSKARFQFDPYEGNTDFFGYYFDEENVEFKAYDPAVKVDTYYGGEWIIAIDSTVDTMVGNEVVELSIKEIPSTFPVSVTAKYTDGENVIAFYPAQSIVLFNSEFNLQILNFENNIYEVYYYDWMNDNRVNYFIAFNGDEQSPISLNVYTDLNSQPTVYTLAQSVQFNPVAFSLEQDNVLGYEGGCVELGPNEYVTLYSVPQDGWYQFTFSGDFGVNIESNCSNWSENCAYFEGTSMWYCLNANTFVAAKAYVEDSSFSAIYSAEAPAGFSQDNPVVIGEEGFVVFKTNNVDTFYASFTAPQDGDYIIKATAGYASCWFVVKGEGYGTKIDGYMTIESDNGKVCKISLQVNEEVVISLTRAGDYEKFVDTTVKAFLDGTDEPGEVEQGQSMFDDVVFGVYADAEENAQFVIVIGENVFTVNGVDCEVTVVYDEEAWINVYSFTYNDAFYSFTFTWDFPVSINLVVSEDNSLVLNNTNNSTLAEFEEVRYGTYVAVDPNNDSSTLTIVISAEGVTYNGDNTTVTFEYDHYVIIDWYIDFTFDDDGNIVWQQMPFNSVVFVKQ